jgi:hypothetical protein
MPSPRLFGFHSAKPGPPGSKTEHHHIIRVLAEKLLHHRHRDLPESAAWGVSPLEKYIDKRRDPQTSMTCSSPAAAKPQNG